MAPSSTVMSCTCRRMTDPPIAPPVAPSPAAQLAKPHLHRSGVVDTTTGGSEVSDIRTSKGMFLERGHDATVAAVEDRIARWTLLPVGNGEGLQVLNYHGGEKYDSHFDFFFDSVKAESNGGNRYATVLMYLNDVQEGGETGELNGVSGTLRCGAAPPSLLLTPYSFSVFSLLLLLRPRRI